MTYNSINKKKKRDIPDDHWNYIVELFVKPQDSSCAVVNLMEHILDSEHLQLVLGLLSFNCKNI